MLPWHACSVVSSPGNLLTPLLKREPYPHHFDDNNTSPYGRLWQISTTSSQREAGPTDTPTTERCSGMGSGVEDALIGCPRAECGKNADCSSVVSCGSDACSTKNHMPSYGPLEFPVSAQNLFLDKLDHDSGVKERIPGVCPSVPGYCAQGGPSTIPASSPA